MEAVKVPVDFVGAEGYVLIGKDDHPSLKEVVTLARKERTTLKKDGMEMFIVLFPGHEHCEALSAQQLEGALYVNGQKRVRKNRYEKKVKRPF
ncbi:MAG: hypothetical protein Q8M83_02500 [bacterium]|nr:hypothetical protein [bacterium]